MKSILLATIVLTCIYAHAQVLVKDIAPGPYSGYPVNFVTLNGITYFVGNDSTHGAELWRTDGTTDGTYMVKDICPGSFSGLEYNYDDAFYSSLNILGNNLYFFATTDSLNYALWKSDGTGSGTVLVSNYVSVTEGNIASGMWLMGSNLYFLANDTTASQRAALWRTDGTTAGTTQVTDSAMLVEPAYISMVNGNTLYFTADSGFSGVCLFKTDGTGAGTMFLSDPRHDLYDPGFYGFTKFNGLIYFESSDSAHGPELWVTDGTPEGTHIAVDIVPGPAGGAPYGMTVLNNKMILQAWNDSTGTELYVSDGTPQGTYMLKDIWPGLFQSSNPDLFTVYNNKVYFEANDSVHGEELWVTDGTSGGTQLFDDINQTTNSDYGISSNPSNFTVINGLLYFSAYDSATGYEPWVTDGSLAGTHILADICPGTCYSNPFGFTANGPMMFFNASTQELGSELYRVGNPAAITEVASPLSFKLQPNPAGNHVTLIADETFTGGTIQVIDITGRVVFTALNASPVYELNTSALPGGLYVVKLTDKLGTTGVEKLVIE